MACFERGIAVGKALVDGGRNNQNMKVDYYYTLPKSLYTSASKQASAILTHHNHCNQRKEEEKHQTFEDYFDVIGQAVERSRRLYFPFVASPLIDNNNQYQNCPLDTLILHPNTLNLGLSLLELMNDECNILRSDDTMQYLRLLEAKVLDSSVNIQENAQLYCSKDLNELDYDNILGVFVTIPLIDIPAGGEDELNYHDEVPVDYYAQFIRGGKHLPQENKQNCSHTSSIRILFKLYKGGEALQGSHSFIRYIGEAFQHHDLHIHLASYNNSDNYKLKVEQLVAIGFPPPEYTDSYGVCTWNGYYNELWDRYRPVFPEFTCNNEDLNELFSYSVTEKFYDRINYGVRETLRPSEMLSSYVLMNTIALFNPNETCFDNDRLDTPGQINLVQQNSSSILSEEQLQTFYRKGCLHLHGVLPEDIVEKGVKAAEKLWPSNLSELSSKEIHDFSFPFTDNRLNGITLHPSLLKLMSQILAVPVGGLRIIQSCCFAKRGSTHSNNDDNSVHVEDFELIEGNQMMHLDFGNNSLLAPPNWLQCDRHNIEEVQCILYYSNNEEVGGGTSYVPGLSYNKVDLSFGGWLCDNYERSKDDPRCSLYEIEKRVNYQVGSMFLFTLGTWHRGTPVLPDKTRRYHHLCFRRADVEWVGGCREFGEPNVYSIREMKRKCHSEFELFFNTLSTEQRSVLGV